MNFGLNNSPALSGTGYAEREYRVGVAVTIAGVPVAAPVPWRPHKDRPLPPSTACHAVNECPSRKGPRAVYRAAASSGPQEAENISMWLMLRPRAFASTASLTTPSNIRTPGERGNRYLFLFNNNRPGLHCVCPRTSYCAVQNFQYKCGQDSIEITFFN